MKELGSIIDRDERDRRAREFEDDSPRDQKVGKKEQAKLDAANVASQTDDDWGDDLHLGQTRLN